MSRYIKRGLDLVGAIAGLIVLALPLLAISVVIRLDSRGPALFRQTRVGLNGRPFEILKFRTMRLDAPGVGPAITIGADPRITRVGHHLRKLKVDELPQLLNVLTGQMALVGPRPEVPYYMDKYSHRDRLAILSIKPGMTDYAAIYFRNESDLLAKSSDPERTYINEIMPRKLLFYKYYIGKNNIVTDIRLILLTVLTIAGLRVGEKGMPVE